MTPVASPASSSSSGRTLAVSPISARTIANDVTSICWSLRPAPSTAATAAADHVALRGDEQHFHHVLVVRRHVVADDLEIEDRVLDRDRDVVLRLVLDRALRARRAPCTAGR